MRTLALLALVVAALACGADAPPSCGAPGLVRACACVGGAQGAQECSPGGAWSVCACPDGGAMEAGVDAGSDAAREVGADAMAVDADPGCDGGAPNLCTHTGTPTCVQLRWDQRNCGRCGSVCQGENSECYEGVCMAPSPDAGTD